MSFAQCHRCLRASNVRCAGPVACPFSGAQLPAHIEAGYCPHPEGPRFGTATPPADWPEREATAQELARKGIHAAQPPAVVAVPRDKWPLMVRILASSRAEGETGVGDTAARVLHHLGADALAWLYEKATGRPCGCSDRQAKLNQLYPY